MVHTKNTVTTTYLACHELGHGGGHFSDLEFDTKKQAEDYIAMLGENVNVDYHEHWLDVKGHMFLAVKKTLLISL